MGKQAVQKTNIIYLEGPVLKACQYSYLYEMRGCNNKKAIAFIQIYSCIIYAGSGRMEVIMNVLITGGYGFIGSHVAEKFFKEGYHIFIIDNLSTGNSKNINFKHTFFQLDIEDPKCREVFRSNKFDVVVHLAAQINVVCSIEDPYRDTLSNVLGLTNILQLSAEYGVKKFVFASSAAVYGNNQEIPLKEAELPDPLSPYGMSKATGELYCKKWRELYGLNTICFRFSNVYGPRQGVKGEGGVISIFMERMAQGKKLVIFGDGNQTRDFIYVKDIADAIYGAVDKDITGIFNLSTGWESSVNELIDVLDHQRPIGEVVYEDEREGDIKNSCLDNTRIKQAINWEPRYYLAEGLKNTYTWYMDYYGESRKQPDNEKTEAAKVSAWRRLSSLVRESGLLSYIENLLLFLIVCFMTIISQNAANQYLLDYKLIYVVLMGSVHGIKQALLAAVLSCALYIYLYIEKGRDIISLIYDTEGLLQISFYLLVSIILGYIIDNKSSELQNKEAALQSLEEKLAFLNEVHTKMLAVKDALCEQVLNTQDSYGKVYSVVTQLYSLNPAEVLSKGITVLEDMLKSDKVTIYMLSDSQHFAFLAAKSQKKDFHVPGIVKTKERADIQAVIESKAVYVNDEWLPQLPVMSAPIMDRENVIAIASIYAIEFENLTLHRQNLFSVTANLISYTLTNAYKYAETAQDKYDTYPIAAEAGSFCPTQNQQ